jgi:hypothetical protein
LDGARFGAGLLGLQGLLDAELLGLQGLLGAGFVGAAPEPHFYTVSGEVVSIS